MEMNDAIKLTMAIDELIPEGTSWTVRGDNIDTDIWIEDEKLRPSKTSIQEKMNEIQLDYDAKTYARNRKQNFPNEHDLLVALWEKVMEDRPESADALQVKRSQVKNVHQKPE